jgi:copper(I)-binding protein
MHETKMDNGVMRMRAIGQLPLPAGKSVELKPNGYHVMLLDLTRPLNDGDAVPLILTVQDASGTKTNLQVNAVVRPLTAGADEAPAKHTR